MKYQRLAAICCAAVMVFTVISSGIAMAGEEFFDAVSAGYVVRPSGDTFMDQDFAVVNTDAGALRGYMENGVYTYLGIQYAQAGRFEVPRPVDSWEGVKNCFDYGPVSPSTPVHDVEVSQFF